MGQLKKFNREYSSYTSFLYSYLYIIIVTDDTITDTKSISTASLLEESLKSRPLFYVTAVVNVSQYVLGKGLSYILGAGDNTTDISAQVFYNRKVKDECCYFFRIFSFDSTNEVCIISVEQLSILCNIFNRMKCLLQLSYRKVSC